jgi:hypothetical protein
MEKIEKVMECSQDLERQKLTIDKYFDEAKLGDLDFKYFCLVNGIFNKNIYPQLKSRLGLIKYVSETC